MRTLNPLLSLFVTATLLTAFGCSSSNAVAPEHDGGADTRSPRTRRGSRHQWALQR
ncbi:MAG: hypothetical protein JRH20_12825 [Deltaproteobacteria bacterium]|nr:hypothetical protein [Deltaproteobacteria bacterium]